MMRRIFLYIIAFFCCSFCWAQPLATPKKHELRAVWLTTLSGLDWPRTKVRNAADQTQQQKELCDILDQLQAARINTVMLQTRVRGSVIYPSKIEPWDICLTGSYDKHPGYDPLAFAIDECHKRGMELHAWVVTIPCFKTMVTKSVGKRSVLSTHKHLCKRHNDTWYLDPGIPETADYLVNICKEIASNYDVDGIHFDYIRYPENAKTFPDNDTYRKFGQKQNKASWRRENITRCVREMYHAIKSIKPWIKVSSSPVGKYADVSRFSAKGWNAYEAVSQDAQRWMKEGIHDMLLPMMYFQGNHFYPFAMDWQENSAGRIVAPGLGIYFLSPSEKNWDLGVIEREMNVIRLYGLGGQAYFRSKFLTDNTKGLYDYMQQLFYPYPALTPPCTWDDNTPPTQPEPMDVCTNEDGSKVLQWTPCTDNICQENVRYNVYASNTYPVDTTRPENLVSIKQKGTTYTYDAVFAAQKGMFFAVTSIDRFGNESAATQLNKNERLLYSPNKLYHECDTVWLPSTETDFIIITDACGRIVRTDRKAQFLPTHNLPNGIYNVRTLQRKGVSRRIGTFVK